MRSWTLTYVVTADFRPYRYWVIQAESESEARLIVSNNGEIPMEELNASLVNENQKATTTAS